MNGHPAPRRIGLLAGRSRDVPLERVRAALERYAEVLPPEWDAARPPVPEVLVVPTPEPAALELARRLDVPLWTWIFGEPEKGLPSAHHVHRAGGRCLVVRLVEIAPDATGTARVLVEGAFKTHPLGVRRTLRRIWPVIADWPTRVLAGTADTGATLAGVPLAAAAGRSRSGPMDALCALRNAVRRLVEETLAEDWRIGILPRPPASLLGRPELDDVRWLPAPPGGGFRADPFGVETAAGRFVFVEDCPPGTDTAGLAVLRLDRAGRIVEAWPLETDLEGHLSWPFVFRHRGRLWMLPEHAAGGHTVLLECTRFPDRWRTAAVLLSDFPAVDPVLHVADDRLWLFATDGGGEDVTLLHLFHAPELRGPWHPHPANPVLCDIRAARPAGPLFEAGGTLWRPAQDCSGAYGGAVVLCRVERLDPFAYLQRPVRRIVPPPELPDGAHTLAPLGTDAALVDAKRHRADAATAVRRLLRLFAGGTRRAPAAPSVRAGNVRE